MATLKETLACVEQNSQPSTKAPSSLKQSIGHLLSHNFKQGNFSLKTQPNKQQTKPIRRVQMTFPHTLL